MQNPNHDDKKKLLDQWQADAASLRAMVRDMQNEIIEMQEAKEPSGHIELRQEMIAQYETTISKLETLIGENE